MSDGLPHLSGRREGWRAWERSGRTLMAFCVGLRVPSLLVLRLVVSLIWWELHVRTSGKFFVQSINSTITKGPTKGKMHNNSYSERSILHHDLFWPISTSPSNSQSSQSPLPLINFLPSQIPNAVAALANKNHPSNHRSTKPGSSGLPRASDTTLFISVGKLLRSSRALEITYVADT